MYCIYIYIHPYVYLTDNFHLFWACPKMGHAQNMATLIGRLILKHQFFGYSIFRQSHIYSKSDSPKKMYCRNAIFITSLEMDISRSRFSIFWGLLHAILTPPKCMAGFIISTLCSGLKIWVWVPADVESVVSLLNLAFQMEVFSDMLTTFC